MEEIVYISKEVREDVVNNIRTRQILLESMLFDGKEGRQQVRNLYHMLQYGIWVMDKLGLLDDTDGIEIKATQIRLLERIVYYGG